MAKKFKCAHCQHKFKYKDAVKIDFAMDTLSKRSPNTKMLRAVLVCTPCYQILEKEWERRRQHEQEMKKKEPFYG